MGREKGMRLLSRCLVLAGTVVALTAGAVAQTSNRQVTVESKLFATWKNSVFTVRTGGSKGTAFLVDSKGLIVTNHHVVGGAERLKLEMPDGRWFEARVLEKDRDKDVAILHVHPDVVATLPAFTFPSGEDAPPFEGEAILAMGSPLSLTGILTTGVISKVGPGVLMSDVNINAGNSGGPVLNWDGQVVGIATFAVGRGSGPGVSGIVSHDAIAAPLRKALSQVEFVPAPRATALPQPRPERLSPEEIETGARSIASVDLPHLKGPRNFRTDFETPFHRRRLILQDLQERAKQWQRQFGRRYKNGAPPPEELVSPASYFWERYVGEEGLPTVAIKVVPVPKATAASSWNSFFGALAGVRTSTQMEFRDDFARMEVVRDGAVMETYDEHRLAYSEFFYNWLYAMNDAAFGGYVLVDPLYFRPGSRLELRFWKNDHPKPTVLQVPESLRRQIWAPFEPWARRNQLL